MARTSNSDPIEKFRFRVTVIALDVSVTGAIDTLAGLAGINKLSVVSRAGFSEVTLPKITINEMTYRENIDGQRFIKVPGLARFEKISLRRGVTANRDLYDWYRLVNEDLGLLSAANELLGSASIAPTQSDNFRKDVIIEVLNREGRAVKAWYLLNAWPSGYSPGNDLNSTSEEKLIEEINLSYELMLEIEGGAGGFAKEMAKGALLIGAGALLEQIPFLR